MSELFLDLHRAVAQLKDGTVLARSLEITQSNPGVWVVAVGGFPITEDGDEDFQWCGSSVTPDRIQKELRAGLGLSATLTYMNKAGHPLDHLGNICIERDHDWAYQWMTLSMVFSGVPYAVEQAFTRDRRFFMSWPVLDHTLGYTVFVATGTIKDWVKYTANADNPDFDRNTRASMQIAKRLLEKFLPAPDREQHFITDLSYHETILKSLPLKGKKVLEIGAGHGELTNIILKQDVALLEAYEIEEGLCKLPNSSNFRLFEVDARTIKPKHYRGYCLISNPPYQLLPLVRQIIKEAEIEDVLLMIPERRFGEFPGYTIAANITGEVFDPPSNGRHILIGKGFKK